MNIAWLLCAVLLQDCIGDVLPARKLRESDESPNWVNSLMKYIEEATNANRVTLITDCKKNVSMITSQSIDELFTKIVKKFLTLRINIADVNESKESVLNHGIDDDTFFDSATTFFIFVHHFSKTFGTQLAQRTVDTLLEMSTFKLDSQFLLVLVSQKLSDGMEELLKYAWTEKLLDFTIIEFVETQTSEIAIYADYEAGTPIIHRFNPFKNEYTRTNWTLDTEWFPDKVLDMWGHPLKIGVIHRPPFLMATFDKFMEPVKVEGANIELLRVIAKELNFTMKYLPDLTKFQEITNSDGPTGISNLMHSGKVDLAAYLSPHYSNSMKNNRLRTTTIRLEKLCTIVPILPRAAMPFSLGFYQAYFVYFVIIIVFWVFSHILRFKSQSWYPFGIARILLGITAAGEEPTRISERTLYACLLLVSGIFSSSIYTAITSISLQTNAEMKFSSFSDLDRSGLTPMISSYLFNKTFEYTDDTMIKLKKKTVIRHGNSMSTCPDDAAKDKNISCLLLKSEAMAAVRSSTQNEGRKIKVTEPCFWSDSTAFLLGKGSPYRSRINDVILLLKEAGLLEKWYKVEIHTVWNDPTNDEEVSRLDVRHTIESLLRQLYAIEIVGYTLSILTFIGEIIVNWILRCRILK